MKSFLAGVCISLGGTAYLASEVKLVGAFLFSIGLLLICTMEYNLFTGKVCYLKFKKVSELRHIMSILIMNFLGTFVAGNLIRICNSGLVEKAKTICSAKLQEGVLVVPLAVFCNILIYYAVQEYKVNVHSLGKYISIILCVVVFIMCGFEHCIANMFYFSVAGFSVDAVLYLALNIFGNALGGIVISRMDREASWLERS